MRPRAARPAHRFLIVSVALMLIAALTLSGPGASAQNVESLRARAERLADELDDLERRAAQLDEEYLQLQVEMEDLEEQRTRKQAEVERAREEVDAARSQATGYLVEAYIGAGSADIAVLGSTDVNDAVRQRALLEIVRGDRELLADHMDVTRQDLDASVAELERAEAELAERRAASEEVVERLQGAVDEHQSLLEGTNAELQEALDAERARREAEAAAAAERRREAEEREAAAARAEQAARTTTTAGPRPTAGEAPSSTRPAPAPTPGPAPAPSPTPAPAPGPPPVSAPNGRAAGAIAAARSVLGTPYRWAGTSPSTGFDCSGLLVWSWAKVGVSLPRTSRGMYAGTQRISESQLQPGDLVFYGSPVYHVGMYVGGGQMIHSPRTGDVVKIAPIHRGFGNPVGYGRIG